ncbi:ABC transporter substrate-binding protein [Vibrio olivae]|uniref:ABC transporter substrate-binding protein n=1 Tax=Vibrio olivae TaxID=1243002 RepID=A0ABV5HNG4_9VIBR
MKKRLRSYLSTAVKSSLLVASLAGFQSTAMADDNEATLTILNSQWLDALRGESLWGAVKKFEATDPTVTLEREMISSSEMYTKMMTQLAGGQGADLLILQEGLFYSAANAGFLTDISKAVEGVDNLNVTNENGVIDGERLGIAWQRAPYALIYNKTLTDDAGVSAPTTVDELIASAKAVHDKSDVIGFTARHRMADVGSWSMDFQNWAFGYGVNWVNEDGELTINTPEAVKAVKAFKKLYDADIIPKGDDMPTQRTRFKQNQVAFSIDNSGGTLNIANGGELDSKNLAGALLPFPQPGAHQQLFIALNAKSEHKAEAIKFLKWLMSADAQNAMRQASGPDALATDVPVTQEFLAANPWAAAFAEAGKHSRSTLIPGYENETPAIMRTVMGAVEKVIVAGEDPEEALAYAQKRISLKY